MLRTKILMRVMAAIIICTFMFSMSACKDVFQPIIQSSKLFAKAEIFMKDTEIMSILYSSVSVRDNEEFFSSQMIRNSQSGYFTIIWSTTDSVYRTVFDANGIIYAGNIIEDVLGEVVGLEELSGGRVCVVTEERSRHSRDISTRYHILSADGECQVSGAFDSMNEHSLGSITSDSQSTVFAVFNDTMTVINIDTGNSRDVKIKGDLVRSLAFMSENELFAVTVKIDGRSELVSVNAHTGRTKTLRTFSTQDDFYPEEVIISEDSQIYLLSSIGLATYDADKKEINILFDSTELGLSIISDIGFFVCSEDTFLFLGDHDRFYDSLSGFYELNMIDSPAERTVLRMGALADDVMIDVEIIAALFTMQNPEYEIEIVYYNAYSEVYDSEAMSKARLEVLSDVLDGNAPDIYVLISSELSVLANRDLLYDLSSSVDDWIASHPGMYAENALIAPRVDGRQYYINPFFSVSGFVMERTYRDVIETFTLEECYAFSDAKDLYTFASQPLWELFPLCEAAFVDVDAGEIYFDSPECRMLIDTILSSEAASPAEALMRFETFENFDDYVRLAQSYPSDITMTGYPDGSISEPMISGNIACAVYAHTPHEAGALQFIEFMLSATVQNLGWELFSNEMPVRLASLRAENEIWVQNYTHSQMNPSSVEWSVQSVDGTVISSSNQTLLREYHENRYWEDMFIEIVLSAEQYYLMDYMLLMIFSEETMPYYSGQKSWEDAMQVLQRRASIYVAENYG